MTQANQCRFNIKRDQFALAVDLSIPAQGVSAIFGPSGSGKTSLLRAIAGLDKHADSYLRIANQVWQDKNIFVPVHQRRVGYVSQQASLLSHLTVQANLEYAYRRVQRTTSTHSLKQLTKIFGISHLLERSPVTLSGGESQRVALARCLASSPTMLLLDEPLASLDYSSRQEIMPYLELLHQELEIPIIYVSHALDEVARLADHLVLLDQHGIQASGEIGQMLTRLDLPLAHYDDAEVVIDTVLATHDDHYALSYLDFSGGQFSVPRKDLKPGKKVRVRVAARDVSIALTAQTDTSILNSFAAVIDDIAPESDSQFLLRLKIGDEVLLSRITKKSAHILNLKIADQVFAQAKSIAVLT